MRYISKASSRIFHTMALVLQGHLVKQEPEALTSSARLATHAASQPSAHFNGMNVLVYREKHKLSKKDRESN